jgi:hypothetical protein
VKIRHKDYIFFTLALIALAIIAVDRHWRMDTAVRGREQAMMDVRACEAELSSLNGFNN